MEACPYLLACDHIGWLNAQPLHKEGHTSPLFPTITWTAAPAVKVVETFEELGLLMTMPLLNNEGMRAFGGHTHPV